MGRILAIDYGTKRVGLAVTDALQLIANPLETVHAKDVLAYLKAYVQREPVEAIVLGMPRRLSGEPTDATQHVVGFMRKLQKEFPAIPVHAVDERFTSKMAQQAMLAGGLKKKDRQDKGTVDRVSAAIILQSYLESRAI
ncbi:putative Holliday junction resolvase [Pontibacter ummariensis]|uniref:Putative pre-16S rRNA nuclease n=1 Tax=Pontibacter ummariensis TaxID=1610492 RepID=A0A239GZA7_9BACT|nr:Holliday junction resolvase RuvX [Pontibacter ummariensis]PRY10954.1 putative Holliday junction resolvase [Pontibacter ummariensis]SNS74470.1 putative holliday junction resolvase [Pontibacter ummariensis]